MTLKADNPRSHFFRPTVLDADPKYLAGPHVALLQAAPKLRMEKKRALHVS